MLRVQGNANTGRFQSIQTRLRAMGPAWTAKQIARGEARGRPTAGRAGARTVCVPAPSRTYRVWSPWNFVSVRVPDNWDEIRGSEAVTYAPEGGYFATGRGDHVFTYGVHAFARGNLWLRRQTGYERGTIGGRVGLTAQLSNVSEATGRPETVLLSTTHLRNGSLLFVVGVAPQDDIDVYAEVLRRVRQSLRVVD